MRFFIIGANDVPASGVDKTSVIVSMRNKPGALHDLLVPFQRAGIDLTRVETRPSRSGRWNYVFFMDFVGHRENEKVKAVLQEVAAQAADLKILGSYPQAVL